MSIRQQDVLFFGGGDCLEKFGTLSWRTSVEDENAEVHARTGAGATFVDRSGVVRRAAADVPRVEWLDLDGDGVRETPVYIGNPERTNLVTSDNFDSGWTSVGTPVVTSGIADPAGGTSAYRIADDDGAAGEYKYFAPTFTGDAVKSALFVVREATMASSGVQRLAVYDATAATYRLALDITAWVAGKPTITPTTGTYLGSQYLGYGYWAVLGQTTSLTAANSNQVIVWPAETSAATGSIDVWRANAFDADVPPSSVLDASQVLGADTLYFPFPFKRQGMAILLDFYWRDAMASASALAHIGSATASTDPRFVVQSSGSFFQAVHDNGATASTATLAAAPSHGDRVELLALIDPTDGHVTISQSIGQLAPTTATDATAVTLTDPFAAGRLYLGSAGTTLHSIAQHKAVKVVRYGGTAPTLDEMRGLFA